MASKKFPVVTSPRGTAKFPRLDTPDTKFKAEGEYSIKLVIPAEQAAAYVAELDAHYAAAQATCLEEENAKLLAKNPKAKKLTKLKEGSPPYKIDEETGNYEFHYKMKAKVESKKTGKTFEMKPAVFDAAKNAIDPSVQKVGGGSICRVAAEVMPYYTALAGCGVSLRLKGVQVIERREWGGPSADSCGFDMEDEGELEDTQQAAQDDNGGDF